MELIKLNDSHLKQLEQFCFQCDQLGWENNSSLKKIKYDMVYKNNGAYLALLEDEKIVSIAGYYRFFEYDNNGWRIFYRSASLPKTGPNKGLHRGTSPRGRMYIENFIKLCDNKNLYLTTNIENKTYSNITRYHRSLEIESRMKDSYVFKVDEIILYDHLQTIWKVDVDKFLARTNNDK
jgi:hypothetical protein